MLSLTPWLTSICYRGEEQKHADVSGPALTPHILEPLQVAKCYKHPLLMGPWLVVTVTLSHLLPTVLSATLLFIPIMCRLKRYIKLLYRLCLLCSPAYLRFSTVPPYYPSVCLKVQLLGQCLSETSMLNRCSQLRLTITHRGISGRKNIDGVYLTNTIIWPIHGLQAHQLTWDLFEVRSHFADTSIALQRRGYNNLPSCRLNTKLKKHFRDQSLSLSFLLRSWQQCTH